MARERVNPFTQGTPERLLFDRHRKAVASAEPLLGPVDLVSPFYAHSTGYQMQGFLRDKEEHDDFRYWAEKLDWVVTGGESGPNARPMHPDWARSLRDQCAAAGGPFNFKQWGEWLPYADGDGPFSRDDPEHNPKLASRHVLQDGERSIAENLMIRIGKKRAGRLLDGVLHDAYPLLPGTGRGTSAAGGGAPAA